MACLSHPDDTCLWKKIKQCVSIAMKNQCIFPMCGAGALRIGMGCVIMVSPDAG
jgi:hypothetical protein